MESGTGEELEDIWDRINSVTLLNDWSAIESDTWIYSVSVVDHGTLDASYNFKPQVPHLLLPNHALMEEDLWQARQGEVAVALVAMAQDGSMHLGTTALVFSTMVPAFDVLIKRREPTEL